MHHYDVLAASFNKFKIFQSCTCGGVRARATEGSLITPSLRLLEPPPELFVELGYVVELDSNLKACVLSDPLRAF